MNLTQLDQHLLMAVMALAPNAYGITVMEHIERRAGYKPSVGAVYAALDKLEEKGFVSSRKGEPSKRPGGRRKLFFTITAPGERALNESLRATKALARGLRLKEAFRPMGALA
jgi:PadR family transcriptional regulator, regulatory protein PadR